MADVNVWIALAYGRHQHHDPVRAWFDALPDESIFFCRLTQLGFLRLLTTRAVMGADTVSQQEAWRLYDEVTRDLRVGFLSEPASVEGPLRNFTQGSGASHRVWSDAYLAAFASVAGLQIATLDQAFASIKGIDVTLISP